jgi:histidinol-phosphate/aromatic aminotransferase/cobyric acid decarboxylase-like protein
MVGTLEVELALNAGDRCDRCGAQAIARATLSSGSALLFCGHHFRAHEASLRAASASIAHGSLPEDARAERR